MYMENLCKFPDHQEKSATVHQYQDISNEQLLTMQEELIEIICNILLEKQKFVPKPIQVHWIT